MLRSRQKLRYTSARTSAGGGGRMKTVNTLHRERSRSEVFGQSRAKQELEGVRALASCCPKNYGRTFPQQSRDARKTSSRRYQSAKRRPCVGAARQSLLRRDDQGSCARSCVSRCLAISVIDGANGARFIQTFKRLLRSPESLKDSDIRQSRRAALRSSS